MKVSDFEEMFAINLGEDCESSVAGVQYYHSRPDNLRIAIYENGTQADVDGKIYELEND